MKQNDFMIQISSSVQLEHGSDDADWSDDDLGRFSRQTNWLAIGGRLWTYSGRSGSLKYPDLNHAESSFSLDVSFEFMVWGSGQVRDRDDNLRSAVGVM